MSSIFVPFGADLKWTEDSHESIAGDGGEGEDARHDAHHRVERVHLAEYGWNMDKCRIWLEYGYMQNMTGIWIYAEYGWDMDIYAEYG